MYTSLYTIHLYSPLYILLYMTNQEIIDQLEKILGFSQNTKDSYTNTLNQYSSFHNLTLEELLEEAEDDEDNRLRMRKRKINNRIYDFKEALMNDDYSYVAFNKQITGSYSPATIKLMIGHVKTFYRSFDIEIPKIKVNVSIQSENLDDTLTKDMIIEALRNTSNVRHKAIIMFLASSGFDGDTAMKLTVADFLDACGVEYVSKETFDEIRRKDIIPCFHTQRGKTKYDYFTFCSPEATQYIARMLHKRDASPEEPLFNVSMATFRKVFSRLNDKCGFGYTSSGTRRKFHAHGLRRFFATTLAGTQIHGMMIDSLVIEWMLGHKIPSVQEAYYKKNPDMLKDVYLQLLPKLTFEDEVLIKTISSPEFDELKSELDKLIEQYNNISH